MRNAGRHLANGCQLAGLYQFILSGAQSTFGPDAFADFVREQQVGRRKVDRAFRYLELQFIMACCKASRAASRSFRRRRCSLIFMPNMKRRAVASSG